MQINERKVKGALTKTSLPGLDYSLNPYRGCSHGCVYCLHPSMVVLTKEGFAEIMNVNTAVVSHKGRFCRANNHFEHYYSGKLIDLRSIYSDSLLLTPDHKVLAVKRGDVACLIRHSIMCVPDRKRISLGKRGWTDCQTCTLKRNPKPTWIRASDLVEGDFVVIPVAGETRDISFILVDEILSRHRRKHKKNRKRKLSPEKIEKIFELRSKGISYRMTAKRLNISDRAVGSYLHGRSKDADYEIGVLVKDNFARFKGGKTKIPNRISINGDFLRLIGYYLAEGCVSISSHRPNSAYIAFTFHEREEEYISDVINLLKKIFKIKPNIIRELKNKSIHIHSGSNILAFLFATLFGKKSEEMKIPPDFLYLPIEKQKHLLKGILRGDGGLISSPRRPIYVTTSRNLLDSVRMILLRLGIICGMCTYTKGRKRKHVAFGLYPAAQFRRAFADLIGIKVDFSDPRKLSTGIIFDDDYRYAIVPIKSKKIVDYSGPVCNLSVEMDNSYVANLVAVSNCYSPSVLKETRPWGQFVDVKINVAEVLSREQKKKSKGTIGISTVTDPYQPVESKYRLTRECLKILLESDWPISIQTKSSQVLRDIDLIKQFSERDVGFTITCIDDSLRQIFEPNSSPVSERLNALKRLNEGSIPTWVFIGPILPSITERKIENLIAKIADTGVRHVLIDRLRLKPGIWPRIKSAMIDRLPEVLPEFIETKTSMDYYQKICGRIRQLCRAKGLYCEAAFPELPKELGDK